MAQPREKPASPEQPVQVTATWKERPDLDHIVVDEAFVQQLNDRYYLTLGQHRVPMAVQPSEGIRLEIQPVAKLVVSTQTLKKIRDLLNRMLPAEERKER